MRILAWLHMYPPAHNAGAERMLAELLADSAARGHDVIATALHSRHGRDVEWYQDGVRVLGRDQAMWQSRGLWRAADVAVTHLDVTRHAVAFAAGAGTPLVHVLHNDRQLRFHHVRPSQAQGIVANSRWIADTVDARYPTPTVVHPPVDLDRYAWRDGPHDHVVLMNLTTAKGAPLFWELAARMPDVPFLAVRGAYGHQVIPDRPPPNVEILDNQPDPVARVYPRARVVLVPSTYESWGRVAIEAMACGVPVVFAPTPGLDESCGEAGRRVPVDDVAAWCGVVRRLVTDDDSWRVEQQAGLVRADQLDPHRADGPFDRWDAALVAAARRPPLDAD